MNNAEIKLTPLNASIERGKMHLKAYSIKGNVIQAQKCFSEAYRLCLNNFGKDDARNIEILSLLAAAHKFHIGLHSTSKDVIGLLEEMKRLQLLNYGPINPDLIDTYKRLATSYAQSKKYELAIENYFQALGVQSEVLGEFDRRIAHTLERIGDVYNNLVNTQKAKSFYEKALHMTEMVGGDIEPVIAALKLKISRVTPIIPNKIMSF